MSNEQPLALRLADWCEAHSSGVYRPSAEAAAELRRLHAVEVERDQLRAALARHGEPVAWQQPICRYISDVLASDAAPGEKHIARTIMHLLPLDVLQPAQIPEEATSEMLNAYAECLRIGSELDGAMVWRAMLEAALKGQS